MASRCHFTRLNGARCSMPALNGHQLCFQHENRKRQASLHPIPPAADNALPPLSFVYMDDHSSVLANLNSALEAFARHQIDHRQLAALTRLFQTCLKTLRQKKELEFLLRDDDAVREVTWDEDGTALATDPVPAPKPATLRKVTACAEREPARKAKQNQALTPKQPVNSPVFKHLPKQSNLEPMFSHTYASKNHRTPAPPSPPIL